MSDSEGQPLLDCKTVSDGSLTVLTITEKNGWSVEATLDNSREYRGDGVEHCAMTTRCYVSDPNSIRGLAEQLLSAADAMEPTDDSTGGGE